MSINESDIVIIGAGAAGMMCAIAAGKRGRRVVLIEKSKAAGEKIRISGGGRCNFTNLNIDLITVVVSPTPRNCFSKPVLLF